MQEKEETEQKSSYWSIKNVLSWSGKSNTNTLSKEESSTMPSSSKPQSYEADRYPHDLNQAKAIQKGGDKFTKKDILLGLDGLDHAEQLRQSGDLEQALKVSEMAMELLIEFLKTEKSVLPGMDRSTISQRVHVALTEAEEMKQQQQEGGKTSPTTTKKKSTKPKSKQLSDALRGIMNQAAGFLTAAV